jgi:hypothetical protein
MRYVAVIPVVECMFLLSAFFLFSIFFLIFKES